MMTSSIALVLLTIYLMVAWRSPILCTEKNSPFECGFDPLSNMRSPFSTRFFVLVVLFLIFDIEVSLLFPLLSMLSNFITYSYIIFFLLFILVLLVGLLYEWYQGALDWVSFSFEKHQLSSIRKMHLSTHFIPMEVKNFYWWLWLFLMYAQPVMLNYNSNIN